MKYLEKTKFRRLTDLEIPNFIKEDWIAKDYVDFLFNNEDSTFYIYERSNMVLFKVTDYKGLFKLLLKIYDLREDLYIREGFYDKSLNTTIYGQLSKFEINVDEVIYTKVIDLKSILIWYANVKDKYEL